MFSHGYLIINSTRGSRYTI